MKTKVNFASYVLATMATLTLSLGLVSCSKDNIPISENKNYFVVDGRTCSIDKAILRDFGDGNYSLELYAKNYGEGLIVEANTTKYNGKVIDLTKQEEPPQLTDPFGWFIKCFTINTGPFDCSCYDKDGICLSGTMQITADPWTGQTSLRIVDAKAKDKWFDRIYTFSAYWEGKATEIILDPKRSISRP